MLESNKPKARLRSGRLYLLVLFIVFHSIALMGCLTDNQSTDTGIETTHNQMTDDSAIDRDNRIGKQVYAPVSIPYVVENPLEIIYIEEPMNMDHHRTYFQIKGLANQSVEDKINEQIKALYDDMLLYVSGDRMPPYRGIKVFDLPERRLERSYLSITPDFNCNNILSVAGNLSITYYNPGQNHTHISMTEGLNFDLTTGDKFMLQDVFTNDVNGLDIVNDHIVAELNRRNLTADYEYDRYYDRLTLIAPFKGVDKNQKFFLNEAGINIIIDYNNPEFNFGFSSATINIPYFTEEGHVAITERFFDYTEESSLLFDIQQFAQQPTKRFLNDYQLDVAREFETYKKENIDWYVTFGHPTNLADKFVEKLNQIRKEQEIEILQINKRSPINFADQNLYAFRMGSFVNISAHLYYHQGNETKWMEQKYVFDKNGNLVELADLFVAGYDYSSLLRAQLIKTIKEYGYSPNLDVTALLEVISFSINDSSLSFSTNAVARGVEDGIQPIHFYISYKDIGPENLTIF